MQKKPFNNLVRNLIAENVHKLMITFSPKQEVTHTYK